MRIEVTRLASLLHARNAKRWIRFVSLRDEVETPPLSRRRYRGEMVNASASLGEQPMPLKKTAKPTASPGTDQILITTHHLAHLANLHDDTVLRALADRQIAAEAWVDFGGRVVPLFSPTMAIVLAVVRNPARSYVPEFLARS